MQEIKDRIPELAPQRRDRFTSQYGLPEYDAGLLTGSKDLANFYESAMDEKKNSASLEAFVKNVSNWMMGDLSRLLNAEKLVFLTDVRGVMTDPRDADSLLSTDEKGHKVRTAVYMHGW